MNLTKYFLLTYVLFFGTVSFAQDSLIIQAVQREFSQEELEKYKLQEDFIYEEAEFEKTKIQAFFDRLARWFEVKPSESAVKGATTAMDYVKYAIAALALFGLGWFLLKADFSKIIAKKEPEKKRYVEELDIRVDENILLANLVKSKENKHYRDAVRFQYLLAIKSLDEKGIIRWKEWKLSADYLDELNGNPLFTGFQKMTDYFNFSWYGKRELSDTMFIEVETVYNDFMKDLDKT